MEQLIYDVRLMNAATLNDQQALIDDRTDPIVIINDGLIAGMNIVAPLFRSGEMFVLEVMESFDTMNDKYNKSRHSYRLLLRTRFRTGSSSIKKEWA